MTRRSDRDRRNIDVIWSITLFAIAIFLFFTVVMDSTGSLGMKVHDICKGLFGSMAYVLPFLVLVFAVLLFAGKLSHIGLRTTVFSILIFINLCILNSYRFIDPYNLRYGFSDIADYYILGVRGEMGGVIGMEIGSLLAKLFGMPGLLIISIAVLLISVFLVANSPISRFFDGLGRKAETRQMMRELEADEREKVAQLPGGSAAVTSEAPKKPFWKSVLSGIKGDDSSAQQPPAGRISIEDIPKPFGSAGRDADIAYTQILPSAPESKSGQNRNTLFGKIKGYFAIDSETGKTYRSEKELMSSDTGKVGMNGQKPAARSLYSENRDFDREEEARQELMGQVVIDTPDPFFNTLGSCLVAAADGIWDGTTFLHGANCWRMPYCGWRGAYVGDVVGWNERARSHFTAYSRSMVTDIPPIYAHPQQDTLNNLCRAAAKWGTPMYSNGYICAQPNQTGSMSLYDMNLNYIDELLWHFCYDADTTYMRQMWPYLTLHLEWEKRNFDPDGDHLYDAYCCIWASDALYYNGGAVTHSSAYNYRANLLAARIAERIGQDPGPYRQEAEAILKAMNERLWMEDLGYWAEFEDLMGLKRLHKSAAIWSVYTPIDCEACTPEQAWQATCYVDRSIPHIPVRYTYDEQVVRELGLRLPAPDKELSTISSSDWMPYVWSTNNVAHEEVSNMALAYLQAGRSDAGFRLLKADLTDEMYLGGCPGNFGCGSYYDKGAEERFRDFADNVGITSRAIICGLFGIIPDALNGRCFIKPAFPEDWDEVSIRTPYLSYSFRREGDKDIYEVEQHFRQPLNILVRANAGGGAYLEVSGNDSERQTITVDRSKLPKPIRHKTIRAPKEDVTSKKYMRRMGLDDISPKAMKHAVMVDLSPYFNANVDDIYRNEYLTPRPPVTTLQLPKQGVGEWCIPHENHEIEDDGFRSKLKDQVFDTRLGVRFQSPAQGWNIVYSSLWDNYPDEVTIPLSGKARYAYLLMAGSTNNMQSRIENGRLTVTYQDGTRDIMPLENPINWCPIEIDYYSDDYAFWTAPKKPYRVLLDNGVVDRNVDVDFEPLAQNGSKRKKLKATDRIIPGGAAQILKMPLHKNRELESLKVEVLSNDVVIGLMAVTLGSE